MMEKLHLTKAQGLLNSRRPVAIRFLSQSGKIHDYPNVVSGIPNFATGCRNIKIIPTGEILKVRDVCIIEINGHEVYL